jgi:D-amino-acid dehydrogenase
MKVLVLGAGVIGVTTAWYLTEQGHRVEIVDRRDAPGLETSFANGGQISACHAEPWANPDAPSKILQWIWRDDAPLLFRLRMDPHQWMWGARFLAECLPERARDNIAQLTRLAIYSRDSLDELRAATGIKYDELTLGILVFFTDKAAYEHGLEAARIMREYGLDRIPKTVDEAIAIEPALASARERIVGATYTPADESGDAHLFTQRLADMVVARGGKFHGGRDIARLAVDGAKIEGVLTRDREGTEHLLTADAYVVALSSYSPLVTRPIGLDLPVYPAKGYSATVPVKDASKAPRVSVTDDSAKIVITRLGDRLRIAGTAELSGYSTDLNPVRCEALIKRTRELFPDAGEYDKAQFWTGLRPSTPSNVPIIGPTKFSNLYVNTGHGTLGWTLAAGSGRALADIISGRQPRVDFRFGIA